MSIGSVDHEIDLMRIVDTPPLRIDSTVRRAGSLQQTRDNPPPAARMNSTQIERLRLSEGEPTQVYAGSEMVNLPVARDDRVPDGCVFIPAGFSETAILGAVPMVRVVRGS